MNNLEKQSTLAFILSVATKELFPDETLFIEHSLSDGYYCHFREKGRIKWGDVELLSKKIREYLKSDLEIELCTISKRKLMEFFSSQKREDKLAILARWNKDPVPCVRFGDFFDYRFEPMTQNKPDLYHFELQSYDVGFILRFPEVDSSGRLAPFVDSPKLYQIIKEHEEWGYILGIENIGELNRLVETGAMKDMIWVAEGLHEKKISQIADGLCDRFPEKRVVFIAGPSSSGKTTFSKRLSIQLKVNGFFTWPISMDNYYLDRDKIPVDESGHRNFERITALNIDLLCQHVHQLLEGETIPERKFDFTGGVSYETGELITVPQNTFIIFEGIHGLNPILTRGIGEDKLQRIYVSALTQLNVDNEHRVSTSDNRLLRRLVRDQHFRGYSAEETLSRWHNVRLGEERNIFPFQEEADFMFNSSLVYEIPVLANLVIPLLKAIRRKSTNYSEAQRLLTFLSFFVPIAPRHIPEVSILREFIGGSAFGE